MVSHSPEFNNDKYGETKSLETINFMNTNERLNSPRSLEAINILGIEQHRLYYVSFEDYMYMHPELRNLTQDLKELRYNHFEKRRREKIEAAKNKRNELCESNKSKLSKSRSLTQYNSEYKSTAILEEREKLNLLKKQQIGEIKNLIEFELKMEEIRRQNEHKMQLKEQKDEEAQQLRIQQMKEREMKQKMQMAKKEQKLKEENDELEKKYREKQEEEKKMRLEEMKKNEMLEKERQKRQLESRIRQEEFRKKIDQILLNQRNELYDKQKEIAKKEDQRKKNIEEMKRENQISLMEKKRKTKERIEKALMRNDSAVFNKKTDFEIKQKVAEDMRKKFAEERLEKQKLAEQLQKQKEKDIMEVLRRNDEMQQARIDVYNKKQKELEERQREKDLMLQRLLKERHFMLFEKEKKCDEARKRNKINIEEGRKKVLEKISSVDIKIKKQKEDNCRLSLEKYVEVSMRKEDIEDNMRQKDKAMEYQRLQKLEELQEKNRRVELMKLQKMELAEEKKKMNIEIYKSKERMLKKFELLRKENRCQDKNELFNEIFDDHNMNTFSHPTLNNQRSKSTKNVYDNNNEFNQKERAQNLQNNAKGEFEFITNDKKKRGNNQTLEEVVGYRNNQPTKKKDNK